MPSKNKQILSKKVENIKNFAWEKGNMNLTWSVDIGIKTNLQDSIAIMEAATVDLKRELAAAFPTKNG